MIQMSEVIIKGKAIGIMKSAGMITIVKAVVSIMRVSIVVTQIRLDNVWTILTVHLAPRLSAHL